MQLSEKKRKIRVVHYCNQLSLGGTERTMEIFCRYLDPERFEVYASSHLYRLPLIQKTKLKIKSTIGNSAARGKLKLAAQMNARIPGFESILGKNKLLIFKKTPKLRDALLALKPDILHVHYSGRPEFPIADEELTSGIPAIVTTNQFELENTAPTHRRVKKMFFVSNWLLQNKAHWAKEDQRAEVFYNPVEKPFSQDSLRAELQIPADAFVVGRVGRADPGIYDPISLLAYKKIQSENTYFLALSPPENMIREAKELELKNFIALPPTANEIFLSKFYNSLDVLAHARRDGETFGCNIAEAMIHGKPVITHESDFMNAQQETVAGIGFYCKKGDWEKYAEHLQQLKENASLKKELGEKGRQYALQNYEATALTKRLEQIYLSLLK